MSTIRSAATASSAVRSDASLTPAGSRRWAVARNSDCPLSAAATHSVCSSSTFTPCATSTRLISRTIPGRSWPTRSNFTSGAPTSAIATATSGCTIDSSPASPAPRNACASALGLIGVDLDAQNAGELPREMGHAALDPIAAMLGDDAGERLDQAGPIGAEHGEDERSGCS